MVCLIGGGQEINAGEAGLTEWFFSSAAAFCRLEGVYVTATRHRDYHWGQDLPAMLLVLESLRFARSASIGLGPVISRRKIFGIHWGAHRGRSGRGACALRDKSRAMYPIVLTPTCARWRDGYVIRARGLNALDGRVIGGIAIKAAGRKCS